MKIVKLLMVLLLLFGCVSQDFDLEKEVENTIFKVNKTKAYPNHNHNKDLVSYYLPKDVGIKDSNQISTILLSDNYEFVMTLNVSQIMSDKITNGVNDNDYEVVNRFKTVNNQGQLLENLVVIEKLAEDEFLLYLQSENIFFISSVPKTMISNILEKMIVVSRTVSIDEKKVVSQFSNKEEMNYQKEIIELFSESVPTEGFVRDIYEGSKEDD